MNGLMDDDWYDRLTRGARERATAGIRRSGSDPNDPYWRAREAEEINTLYKSKQDAFRRAFAAARARQSAIGASMRQGEAARQRTISGALASQWRPDVGLGTTSDDGGASPGSDAAIPAPISSAAGAVPEAYVAPFSGGARPLRSAAPGGYVGTNRAWVAGQAGMGGFAPVRAGGVSAGYNPSVFRNDDLNYRKKKLSDTYDNLARRWL